MAEETVNAINFGEEYDQQDFGLVDDGKYEFVIEEVAVKTSSKSGNQYLNFKFRIRKDVEQNFKNRVLFYTIGKKEGDPCFDFSRVNKIILTQKDRPDYKSRFLDFDEVLQYLHGLHLVATVETNFDKYSNEDRNEIKDWSWEPSVWDTTDHKNEEPAPETLSAETPSKPESVPAPDGEDEDLPF